MEMTPDIIPRFKAMFHTWACQKMDRFCLFMAVFCHKIGDYKTMEKFLNHADDFDQMASKWQTIAEYYS